jgi:prepilin-type processing-associated H-X9-DG protein
MTVSILGLGCAVPSHRVSQERYAEFLVDAFKLSGREAKLARKLCAVSGIRERYFVSEDPLKPRNQWTHIPTTFPDDIPTMSFRNEIYRAEAPILAFQSAQRAVEAWGGQKSAITHLISVSCTGLTAPGIEFLLLDAMDLPRTAQRLGINFMGCFGAFKGLSVAMALAEQDARNRILVVCTEICSIQFQPHTGLQSLVGNALFADGSAAVVVGQNAQSSEHPLWHLERFASFALRDSLAEMSWNAETHGLTMVLSSEIPEYVKAHVKPFAEQLLGNNIGFEECLWPVHPGGKAIVAAIEEACGLQEWQTRSAWEVLEAYGNMSSATFLFVLDHASQIPAQVPYSVGIGFGPGLSFEAVLLRNTSYGSSC